MLYYQNDSREKERSDEKKGELNGSAPLSSGVLEILSVEELRLVVGGWGVSELMVLCKTECGGFYDNEDQSRCEFSCANKGLDFKVSDITDSRGRLNAFIFAGGVIEKYNLDEEYEDISPELTKIFNSLL